MKFQEFNNSRVYIGVHFNPLQSQKLSEWVASLGIKAVSPSELHSSILVSVDSDLTYDNFEPNTNINVPIDLSQAKFEIFPMSDRGTVSTSTGKALVITVASEWLVKRRIEIQKRYRIKSSSYQPHITLSYDWDKSLDITSLKLPISQLMIVAEYKQHLKS